MKALSIMKKRILLSFAFVASLLAVNAQQLPLYTQIYHNEFLYNPSFTLMEDYSSVTAFYRKQWAQIGTAPVTRGVVFQTPLKSERIGLGLNIINDVNGIFNRTGGYMSYAYNVNLSADHHLLLGLSAGYMQTALGLDDIDDPLVISQQSDLPNAFDATFGVGYSWKNLRVGLAVPHLFDADFNPLVDSVKREIYVNKRHFLGSASYNFEFGEKIELRPTVLVRHAPNAASPLIEGNLVFTYNKMVWVAGNYRHGTFVGVGLGAILSNRVNVGYSYDFTLGDFAAFGGSTHELTLGLKLAKAKDEDFVPGGTTVIPEKNPWDEDLAELRKRVIDLNKQLENQSDTIGNHEERIKALEAQRDSLSEIIKEEVKREVENLPVGNTSYDVRDINNPGSGGYNGSTDGNNSGNSGNTGNNSNWNNSGNSGNNSNSGNLGQGGSNSGSTGTNYSTFQNQIINDDPEAPYGRKPDGTPIGKNERYDGPKFKDTKGSVPLTESNKATNLYNERGEKIKNIDNYSGPVYDAENRLLDYVRNGGDDASLYREYSKPELINDGIRYMAPGNYVVVGSFRSKDNAIKLRDKLQAQGVDDAGIVYNNVRRWFYVYSLNSGDFDQAVSTAKERRASDFPDAWIHVILRR